MNLKNMKNIVILKNLPSNLVDEAIIVINDKEKNKLKNIDKILNNNSECCSLNETDFKRIKNIQLEKRKYIIKEAEMVVNDYLDKIEENKQFKEKIKFNKSYRKMKYANLCLTLISIISTAICILK